MADSTRGLPGGLEQGLIDEGDDTHSPAAHIKSIKSGTIIDECSNCGRCIEVCDDNALEYSINKYKI